MTFNKIRCLKITTYPMIREQFTVLLERIHLPLVCVLSSTVPHKWTANWSSLTPKPHVITGSMENIGGDWYISSHEHHIVGKWHFRMKRQCFACSRTGLLPNFSYCRWWKGLRMRLELISVILLSCNTLGMEYILPFLLWSHYIDLQTISYSTSVLY